MKYHLLITTLSIMLISCLGPEPEEPLAENYVIKNDLTTSVLITTTDYLDRIDSINIKSNDLYKFASTITPFPMCKTMTIFYFDKKKEFLSNDTLKRNPIYKSSYKKILNNDGSEEYTYTITEQDYLDADSIK